MSVSQPSQLLAHILYLREARVRILPVGEEFLVMLYGFDIVAFIGRLNLILIQPSNELYPFFTPKL